jgi:hypothetical protein
MDKINRGSYYEVFIKRTNDVVSFYIDKKDYHFLKHFKPRILESKKHSKIYVRCRFEGKEPTILLHRLLMGAEKHEKIDHINGDGLDNRRKNLRITNYSGNNKNAKIRKDNTSGYKGVHLSKGKYIARIQVNGKRLQLGTFNSAKEAALAYNKKAKKVHGRFAKLNEID